jgi:hypothetical protein
LAESEALQQSPTSSNAQTSAGDVLFPDCNEGHTGDPVLDSELAEKFFLYSTKGRCLFYYSLAMGRFVADFRHSSPIRSLFCEPDGIRCLFLGWNWNI